MSVAANSEHLDVMAIGAHPDDLEIICGGTLALLAKQGYSVCMVDLTSGEPTPRGSEELRKVEAEAARQILGVQLRINLGKPEPPLNVIVTAHGNINLHLPVFQSAEVPVLIVTTTRGVQPIREQHLPPSVQVVAIQSAGPLSAQAILEAVNSVRQSDVILVEGGPQLMGDFFAERYLDELFLTLAPQIAGRDSSSERPGLITGKRFAPEHPLWGTLIGVKRGGSHLFLRYAFETLEHT